MTFDELLTRARAYQESRTLLAGIELNAFGAVGEGATAEEAAGRMGASVRGARLLLDALTALGALDKVDGRYSVPEELRPVEAARPGLMHSVNLYTTWASLAGAVRAGTSVIEPGVEGRDEKWTENFIAAMHRNGTLTAREVVKVLDVTEARRMLDIGGGSGAYSIVFAGQNPELRVVLFDLEHVVPLASGYVGQAGLSERITMAAGDLRSAEFAELGEFDLILLSNICHMLGEEENRDLLARCFRATAAGGRLVIRDFVIDEDRTSPRQAALFALNMLVGTRAGSSYAESEYRGWLEAAGYGAVERNGDLVVGRRVR